MTPRVADLVHRLRPLYYLVRRRTPQVRLSLTQGSELLNGSACSAAVRAVLVEVTEVGQRFHRRLIVAHRSRAPRSDESRCGTNPGRQEGGTDPR
ncbi:hypothetical protein [Amycolatopsis sp. cmx-11-51]|uniref:hypothetical protein n=1 Tax=Amycolatopsis sp. cmx-11-51 TaxID=2785797 RepID=UPI0039E69C39